MIGAGRRGSCMGLAPAPRPPGDRGEDPQRSRIETAPPTATAGRAVAKLDPRAAGRHLDQAEHVVGAMDRNVEVVHRGAPAGIVLVGEDEEAGCRRVDVDGEMLGIVGDDARRRGSGGGIRSRRSPTASRLRRTRSMPGRRSRARAGRARRGDRRSLRCAARSERAAGQRRCDGCGARRPVGGTSGQVEPVGGDVDRRRGDHVADGCEVEEPALEARRPGGLEEILRGGDRRGARRTAPRRTRRSVGRGARRSRCRSGTRRTVAVFRRKVRLNKVDVPGRTIDAVLRGDRRIERRERLGWRPEAPPTAADCPDSAAAPRRGSAPGHRRASHAAARPSRGRTAARPSAATAPARATTSTQRRPPGAKPIKPPVTNSMATAHREPTRAPTGRFASRQPIEAERRQHGKTEAGDPPQPPGVLQRRHAGRESSRTACRAASPCPARARCRGRRSGGRTSTKRRRLHTNGAATASTNTMTVNGAGGVRSRIPLSSVVSNEPNLANSSDSTATR